MPTIVSVAKNAAHYNSEGILIREVDDKLYQVNPNANPFQVFLRQLGQKSPTKSTKCEWYKDQLMPIADTFHGNQTDVDTTLDVHNGGYFRAGQLIVVPRTGEQMRITSISTNELTVVRAYGTTGVVPGTQGYAVVDNDPVMILGSAEQESGTVPTIKSVDLENNYNYTQIFKTAYGASGTARAVAAAGGTYGGDNFLNQRRNKAIEHQRAIELQMLFGERREVTSPSVIRTCGGLRQFLTSNNVAVGGALTESVLKYWMRLLFTEGRGSEQRIMLCSPLIAEAISFWAQDKIQTKVDTEKYGMSIKTYFTDFGTLVVKPHWLFNTGVYAGLAYAFDPSYVKLRVLPGRDTQIQYEVQDKGKDEVVDQYFSELSLEVACEEVHGVLSGVTSYI